MGGAPVLKPPTKADCPFRKCRFAVRNRRPTDAGSHPTYRDEMAKAELLADQQVPFFVAQFTKWDFRASYG